MDRDSSSDHLPHTADLRAPGANVLIQGFYGGGNLGDEAILAAIVEQLRRRMDTVNIIVVSQDPEETARLHEVMAIDRRDLHGQSRLLDDADVLVFGGGGLCNDYWKGGPSDILDDAWGGLPHHLRLPLLAHLQGVPVVVLAQGIGPLRSHSARRMVRQVFEYASDISVRDSQSRTLLREIGTDGPIDVTVDPAVMLKPAPENARSALQSARVPIEGPPLIGVSVRSFQSITQDQLHSLGHSVAILARQSEAHVVILPFCTRGPNADTNACRTFADVLGPEVSTHIIGPGVSPRGMLGIVGRMDMMVAMRYHAVLFSACQRVPFLAVAYDPKVTHLVETLDIENLRAAHPADIDPEQTAAWLEQLWASREQPRARLTQAAPAWQDRFNRTMDRLIDRLKQRMASRLHAVETAAPSPWTPQAGPSSARTLWTEAKEQLATAQQTAQRQAAEAARQLKEARQQQDKLNTEITRLQEQLERQKKTGEDLKRKLQFSRETARDIAHQLQQIWDSPSWQFMNRLHNSRIIGRLWAASKRCIPTRIKESLKRRLRQGFRRGHRGNGKPEGADAPGTNDTRQMGSSLRGTAQIIQELQAFLERVDGGDAHDFVVFFAGVKFIESEGQRVTQMIRELIAHGVPVLLLYFRWESEYHQPVPAPHHPLFFQIPIDLFDPQRKQVIAYPYRPSLRRSFVMEFPHPLTFQWVNEFNLSGWGTVYDIIDDWEEFHTSGKAVWYEPAVEQYLCANATGVTAIVPLLARKASSWVPGLNTTLVPNGVSPTSFDLTLPPKDLPRGEITVGYFGYLTPAWFDWQMVADIAARRDKWRFHIVGYGEPVPVRLTDNVDLLGKVPHHQLYSYTQCWDVAIVPFIPSDLSRGADPIKVYEYLTLGLPVVTTDIPHLRSYPGVHVAESAEQFEQLLEVAATSRPDRDAIEAFLQQCTWYQRGLQLIEAAHAQTQQPRPELLLSDGGGA